MRKAFMALCLACNVHASVPGANACDYIFLKASGLLWREFSKARWHLGAMMCNSWQQRENLKMLLTGA